METFLNPGLDACLSLPLSTGCLVSCLWTLELGGPERIPTNVTSQYRALSGTVLLE